MILVNSKMFDLDGVLELNFATDQRLIAWRNSVEARAAAADTELRWFDSIPAKS